MGWDFTQGASKSDIIRQCTDGWESDHIKSVTLKSCIRGNVLWTVRELTHKKDGSKDRFIGCDLLGKDKGYGWGKKSLEESMGPTDHNCPLSYFDMVPCPKGPYAALWREEVRKYHERRSFKIKVGDILVLKSGCRPNQIEVSSVRPLKGYAGCRLYKVPRRLIFRVGKEEAVAAKLEGATV